MSTISQSIWIAIKLVILGLICSVSAAYANTLDLNSDGIPVLDVPPPTAAEVQTVEAANLANPNAPLQFAIPITVDTDITQAGLWDFLAPNTARLRLIIRSTDAANLNFYFSEFDLPADADVTLTEINNAVQHGPFAAPDNASTEFWTPVLNTTDTLLDLRVPIQEQANVALHLADVNYGFKSTTANRAGSCNVNSACPEADDYADEIRAVARMVIDGRFACTGTLMNNTAKDGTPYLLSARHCFSGSGQFDPTLAQTVAVNWNYESSTCGGATQIVSNHDSQSGTTFRASYSNTDMLLLELYQAPPADYQVHYAGWDNRDQTFTNMASIHHPGGSHKRFSHDNGTAKLTGAFNNAAQNETYLRVQWDLGTTEGGSSGSSLLSSEGHVIGQLLGGKASCSAPDGYDWYGRLNKSWIGGGNAQSSLAPWLDAANTGAQQLDGQDFYTSITGDQGNLRNNNSESSTGEAVERDAAEREASEREASEREASEREALEREALEREASEREASEREASEREATNNPSEENNATTSASAPTQSDSMNNQTSQAGQNNTSSTENTNNTSGNTTQNTTPNTSNNSSDGGGGGGASSWLAILALLSIVALATLRNRKHI